MKKFIAIISAIVIVLVGSLFVGGGGDFTAFSSEDRVYDSIEALESEINETVRIAEASPVAQTKATSALGYIIVTDYVTNDGKTDVSDEIQNIIDTNPNRTIYFPDGVYLISKPINTPADPRKSVDLQLSNYAVIRASENFEGEALVKLGGIHPANDPHTVGSNYSLTGGVLDGSGKTNGVTIESGRETAIRNVSIKHTVVGIHVKYGANSGSSDADISDVNIIGTGGTNSTGIIIEGYDNTFTNIRIGNVFIGVHLKSSSNSMRNIHPLYYSDYTDYENSCGFFDEGGNNIYDFCYSDQFCNGFRTAGNISSIFDNCFCFWYTSAGGKEVAFKADGEFNSVVTNFRADFRDDVDNAVLKTGKVGGSGFFDNLLEDSKFLSDITYITYKENSLIGFLRGLFA